MVKLASEECHIWLFGKNGKRRLVKRCKAESRRTGERCKAPATRSKAVCRFHGGRSTGPRTDEGRARCAAAKTIHGTETRAIRAARKAFTKRLAALVELGRLCGAFLPKPSSKRKA